MTHDEIIELAVHSGFFVKDNEAYSPSTQEDHELTPCLKRFAKLVAEKEREACAKLCDGTYHPAFASDAFVMGGKAKLAAMFIRARK